MLRGATFVGSNGAAGAQAATLRSPNITSYLRGPFPGMSPSQIEIVRNTLRFDYRWNSGDIYNGAPNNPYTGKPKLGTATASRPVLAQLDVNGDGARDLVVWTPDPFGAYANSATFTAALAPDFATIQKSTFGAPGDIPVVMDFDNDGIADLGVYRPDAGRSGSQWATASWYWCPSTLAGLGNCSGGGFQGRNFGVAGDEPLVGLKMGTVPYLGVYRPGTATFYWGPASNPAAYSQITLDPLNPLFPRSVLLDDYDGDGKTDLGLHNTNDGSVLLSFSGGNWASAKFLSFPAWSTYSVPSPDPLGALPDERSGGQPIQGLRRSAFGGPRTALALWNPGTQQACVALDPSTADVSLDCDNTLQRGYATTVGAPNDRPLGGLTSTDVVNGVATIAWIANDTGATPRLRRKVVNKASSSMLTERLLTGMLSRGTASFVGDMGKLGTADALPELLVDGKTPGTWLIFWSHTDYATSTPVQMGSVLSRML